MQESRVDNLAFYHGTSGPFARGLLGRKIEIQFPHEECEKIFIELFNLCMKYVSSVYDIRPFFSEAGCPCSKSLSLALQRFSDRGGLSSFEYGHFYATLDSNEAVSYACRSPYGSELLMFIKEIIDALHALPDPRSKKLMDQYPAVSNLFSVLHQPIILEISGLCLDQLANVNGPRDEETVRLDIEAFLDPTVGNASAAFRVVELTPEHIKAVYPIPQNVHEEVNELAKLFRKISVDLTPFKMAASDWP